MLDIKYIRENPELVAKKSAEKGYQVDITQLLGFDQERRELIAQVEENRRQRNEHNAQTKGQKPSDEQLEKGRQLRDSLNDLEHRLEAIEKQYNELLAAVPNVHFDDVPIGDESQSAEVSKFGEQNIGAKDHLDLLENRGLVDFERGAKVAGAKFYFIKGDLALLENALTQYALNFITNKGFTFVSVPNLVNSKVATGTGFAPRTSEQSDEYYIEGEDLSLIATAEMPLTGMHADEIIDENYLPLMYVALSPCYRKEAGSYGKHTRGLFRVHQFNKLEMYVYSTPEKSSEVHAKLLALEEELWQSLQIPYRVINIASGDLGAPAAKKYDIEYWSKADGNYRELTSCSNCTDYQARNLNIRVRRADGNIEMLHTLNGTVVSLARSLVAIVEHYQTEEGKIRVPDVLVPYMQNKTEI